MARGMCPRMQDRLAMTRVVAHGRTMPFFRRFRRSTRE
jgi:hypothetical protein